MLQSLMPRRLPALCFLLLAAVTAASENRSLQSSDSDFVILTSCNKGTSCVPWSIRFGTRRTWTTPITIECDECVTMDLSPGDLTLQQGLEIHGTLNFPEPSNRLDTLNVTTPKIVVQGMLKMRATKNVDGIPNYVFHMIDERVQTFQPIGANANKCGGGQCVAGMKSITVAGGQVDSIPNTQTWKKVKDVTAPNEIVLNLPGGRWREGSEILITGAGAAMNREVVHTITRAQSIGNGDWRFTLNKNLNMPTTTEKDHPIMAVEVALLSRNIVFEGGLSSDELIGGHFWVFRTPSIKQHLEGVDIRNFGQQGSLGRYPIHLHFCNDSPDTLIARNTIRHSNQRCVVIHGTNHVTVRENVSYMIKGHCYLVGEDGVEAKNKFLFNLAANGNRPSRDILSLDGIASDRRFPSLFWIPNAENTLVGNVAIGCIDAGFWFEPVVRGPLKDMITEPMDQKVPDRFEHNVARANLNGVRLYPTGLKATSIKRALFLGNQVYRNRGNGFVINRSSNLDMRNWYFADNRSKDIFSKTTSNWSLINCTFVHRTDDYRRLGGGGCGTMALNQYPWDDTRSDGVMVTLDDVTFEGYNNPGCANSAIGLELFGEVSWGKWCFDRLTSNQNHANYATSIVASKTRFIGAADSPLNFCSARKHGLDVWIADTDGSLRPKGVGGSGQGTAVATMTQMLAFVDPNQCQEVPSSCLSYCNTCFRSVILSMRKQADVYRMKVCSRDTQECTYFYSHDSTPNPDNGRTRIYAHLPPGRYVGSLETEDGEYADKPFSISMGAEVCTGGIQEDDFVETAASFCARGLFCLGSK